jgi:hypothetical protein
MIYVLPLEEHADGANVPGPAPAPGVRKKE